MTAKATRKAFKTQPKPKFTKPSNPKPTKSAHVPTPWLKLKQMWVSGASYEAMAKATDAHYDASKPDPTKPTRAKIWKARHVGVTIDGKLVKFGARGKVKEKGKGKPDKGKKGSAKGMGQEDGQTGSTGGGQS